VQFWPKSAKLRLESTRREGVLPKALSLLDMAATTSPVVWGFLAGSVLPCVAMYWMTPSWKARPYDNFASNGNTKASFGLQPENMFGLQPENMITALGEVEGQEQWSWGCDGTVGSSKRKGKERRGEGRRREWPTSSLLFQKKNPVVPSRRK
jgi:hypothetical protein